MDVLVPVSAQTAVDSTTFRTFKVVFIPAASTEELREETIVQTADRALSAMIDHAKTRFAQQKLSGARLEEFQRQLMKEHGQKLEGAGSGIVPQEAIQKIADMTLCEVVPLLQQQKKTFFLAVNLVVDDKAVSKGLPMNERASSICGRCGLSIQVRGDAFLCRQFDNDEGFYRLDFTSKDLSQDLTRDETTVNSDSLWIPLARALRLSDEAALEKIAKEYKERGNDLYKHGKLREAIWRYHQAGVLLPDRPNGSAQIELKSQILSNQSACKLKLGDATGALADADACLVVRPQWPKAWGRRGEALKALGRDAEAKEAMEKAGISTT